MKLTRHERSLLDFAATHLSVDAQSFSADGMASQRKIGRRLYDAAELLRRLSREPLKAP